MLLFIIFRHRGILLFNFPYHILPIRETEDMPPVKFFGQAFSINSFQCFVTIHFMYLANRLTLTGKPQSVEKPLSLSKNRVWGVAPRQVAGTPVPVFTPFPGERGQGDRDNKSEVYFKNRLFLQSDRLTLTGKPVCFLHPEQTCPFYSPPAMIYSRQYIRKRRFLLHFPYFLISR